MSAPVAIARRIMIATVPAMAALVTVAPVMDAPIVPTVTAEQA